jgi:hypothetical protein
MSFSRVVLAEKMFLKVILFHSFKCCFRTFSFCWNLYILVQPGGWVVDHQCWIIGLNSGLDNQDFSNLKRRWCSLSFWCQWRKIEQWSEFEEGRMEEESSSSSPEMSSETRSLSRCEVIREIPPHRLFQV